MWVRRVSTSAVIVGATATLLAYTQGRSLRRPGARSAVSPRCSPISRARSIRAERDAMGVGLPSFTSNRSGFNPLEAVRLTRTATRIRTDWIRFLEARKLRALSA